MAEDVPMASDDPVAAADDPHERRISEHGAEPSPSDESQNVETGPSAAQHSPVWRYDVHREPAAFRQFGRHRGTGRLIVWHRVQKVLTILSLGPSDRPATKASAPVPEDPCLVGPMPAFLMRCRKSTTPGAPSTSLLVRTMTCRGHLHVQLYRGVPRPGHAWGKPPRLLAQGPFSPTQAVTSVILTSALTSIGG